MARNEEILQLESRLFDFFFGAPERGLPRHAGYSLGFELVARHVRSTGRTAAQLVHVPADTFWMHRPRMAAAA